MYAKDGSSTWIKQPLDSLNLRPGQLKNQICYSVSKLQSVVRLHSP